ncbi:hypothetical protein ACFQ3P_37430 [Paraburkholderia sabiae]|uniref:Uncharacterized protein n=1 Tax=Paraburkholderia sabiae TaxID=273251 RepID=A0ABU9QPF9_9BURK|nr:hypothetical protein [Paraburkholderia sabiae]WJZ74374.1 hypothetical protein QEN71_00730 [Paraburkholderia sabiae]CAD6562581.1 hypothetical protein LMG24235_07820 [Paraburkholderia sabiae]
MAVAYTAEDSARRILSIMVDRFNLNVGGNLPFGSFNTAWHSDGFTATDFAAGRDYAEQQGWVSVNQLGLKLEPAGFAAA